MQLSDAIKIRIKKLLKEKSMKTHHMCERAGINQSTVTSFMNDEKAVPKLPTILQICYGLDITLGEFFSDPIFDEAEYDD